MDKELKELENAIDTLKKATALVQELINKQNKDFKVELSTMQPGETFFIGEMEFVVLEQCPGETKVISKGFVGKKIPFDNDSRDYKESSIRKLLEGTIQPKIEEAVGADNLIEHTVDLTSVDMQNEFSSLNCKVRLITFDEARRYNDLIANKELSGRWWTLTPWSTEKRGWEYSMAVVSSSGDFYDFSGRRNGVRPFCILKSSIFVSKGEK